MFSKCAGLIVAVIAVMGITNVQASEALANKNNCLICHKIDTKLIGPAYKDVAAKYKDRKDAAEYLADKIKKGGSGVWGTIPMTPNPQVSDADLKAIVAWILSLDKPAASVPAVPVLTPTPAKTVSPVPVKAPAKK